MPDVVERNEAAEKMDEAFRLAVAVETTISALEIKAYQETGTTLNAATAHSLGLVGMIEVVPVFTPPPTDQPGIYYLHPVPVPYRYFRPPGL